MLCVVKCESWAGSASHGIITWDILFQNKKNWMQHLSRVPLLGLASTVFTLLFAMYQAVLDASTGCQMDLFKSSYKYVYLEQIRYLQKD